MTGPTQAALEALLAPTNYQTIYSQLGRLLAAMPPIQEGRSFAQQEWQQWLGRAAALVRAVGNPTSLADSMEISRRMGTLPSVPHWDVALSHVTGAMYRAMAECEIHMPASASGAFLPVGSSFDTYATIAKVFAEAKRDVFIVDAYLDDTVLVEFGEAVPQGVSLRLMADESSVKPTLAVAAGRWRSQHGAARPLAARLAPARALHDRTIFIDGAKAWSLSQSLKDFAKRSPAEIYRADDTADMKIAHYEGTWSTARVIV